MSCHSSAKTFTPPPSDRGRGREEARRARPAPARAADPARGGDASVVPASAPLARAARVSGDARWTAVRSFRLLHVVDQPQAVTRHRARPRLRRDLAQLWVLDDLRRRNRRRHQVADRLFGLVLQAVRTVGAGWEVHRLAYAELTLTLRSSQRRPSAEDDEQLLPGVVEVVDDEIARVELVH